MCKCKTCGSTNQEEFYPKNKATCKKCVLTRAKEKYKNLNVEERTEYLDYNRNYQRNNLMRYRFKGAENRAKHKGLDFTITEEEITNLLIKQNYRCALSGKVFDITSDRYSPSLERVDSSQGYVTENIMWVCSMVNYMKAEYTTEEFHEMVERIYKFNKSNSSNS